MNKKQDIFNQAIETAKSKNLLFIEDVVAFLSISKQTFYVYFPKDSDEYDTIKSVLDINRIKMKQNMRKKWYESDNASLQISLMKLIGTEEERNRLSNIQRENKMTDNNISIKWNEMNAG